MTALEILGVAVVVYLSVGLAFVVLGMLLAYSLTQEGSRHEAEVRKMLDEDPWAPLWQLLVWPRTAYELCRLK